MKAKTAFTKKDLAVVLVCLVFVLVNIAAVGKSGRARSKQLVCLANLRQLTNAWITFAKDNDGKLVNGHVPAGCKPGDPYWVISPLDEYGNPSGNTPQCDIEHKKRGIREGKLFPYVNEVRIYHCPADDRYTRPPDPHYDGLDGGFRSYSIPRGLNDPDYGHTIKIYSQIENPAEKYAFVEENDSRGYNRGSWVLEEPDNIITHWEWVDPVAAWHDEHGALGFADGHVEMHKWQEEATIKLALMERWVPRSDPDTVQGYRDHTDHRNSRDLLYMKQHYPHLGIDN